MKFVSTLMVLGFVAAQQTFEEPRAGPNTVQGRLNKCDSDKDGSLTLQELSDCLPKSLKGDKRDARIAKLADKFAKTDLDNDGKLTGDELEKFVHFGRNPNDAGRRRRMEERRAEREEFRKKEGPTWRDMKNWTKEERKAEHEKRKEERR